MSDEYPDCERSLFWGTEARCVALEDHILADQGGVHISLALAEGHSPAALGGHVGIEFAVLEMDAAAAADRTRVLR